MRKFIIFFWIVCSPVQAFTPYDLGKGRPGDFFYIHHPPDPVNTRTGNFYLPVEDLFLPCFNFSLEVYRSYNSFFKEDGPFGPGWMFNYNTQIVESDTSFLQVIEPDGFVSEYLPIELSQKTQDIWIQEIVEARKKGDIEHYHKPEGRGVSFYEKYSKDLANSEVFFEKEKALYLPSETHLSPSGKYVSRQREVSFLEKTPKGYVRNLASGQKEEFNQKGLMVSRADLNDNRLIFEYDTQSHLSQVQDSCGRSLKIIYNSNGKITSIKDSLERELLYSYDKEGRLILAQGLQNQKASYLYDKFNRMTSIVFGDGSKIEIRYDPKTAQVIQQQGPGKKITSFEYEKSGGVLKGRVTDNEGGKSSYEFIQAENKSIMTDKFGNKTIIVESRSSGKPLSIKDEKGIGDDFAYDNQGNLISKTDASKKTTTFSYDSRFLNKVSEIKNPDGSYIRYVYDNKGNLTYAKTSGNEFLKISYEKHGKIETMVDQRDIGLRFEYNSFGKPIFMGKLIKGKTHGSIQAIYDKTGEILKVDYLPNAPETPTDIKSTYLNLLQLLKPAGIHSEM